jgi:shikimate dehydrogenase
MTTSRKPSILAGLIGSGIQASRTPALHENEGDAQGMRYLYRLIDLDALKLDINALPELLTSAQHMGYTGLNITFPCKQAVIPLLDELSAEARGIGAVNTVLFKDGKRIGHNTAWVLPKVFGVGSMMCRASAWCRWGPVARARRLPMRCWPKASSN